MVELIQDRIFVGIVCCDVDPEEQGAFEKVDQQCSLLDNGTLMNPWKTFKENRNLHGNDWEDIKPLPCKEKPGFWHYVIHI